MFEDAACCVVENGKFVVREENNKSFVVKNSSRKNIQVCRVDGCLVTGDHSRKCDFMFVLDMDNPKKIVLVEMKGTDHIRAIEQLVAAAEQLDLKSKGILLESYIVGSPNPKVQTKFQKELLKMAARYKKASLSLPVRKNDRVSLDWP